MTCMNYVDHCRPTRDLCRCLLNSAATVRRPCVLNLYCCATETGSTSDTTEQRQTDRRRGNESQGLREIYTEKGREGARDCCLIEMRLNISKELWACR